MEENCWRAPSGEALRSPNLFHRQVVGETVPNKGNFNGPEFVSDCVVAYLIKCTNGTIYVGRTIDIDERIIRHNAGYVPSTIGRLPVVLITYMAVTDKYKTFEFEKYLKGGSGRAFLNKRFV